VSIDITQAEAAPGVLTVLTARDVPVNEYGLQIPDQPVLCGPVSEESLRPEAVRPDIVRFIGDQVAAIVAETEAQAAAAAKLIQVEYEDLPVLTDPAKIISACITASARETPRRPSRMPM
jgi:CO/xanthine dehydrogenase Mo-binding subunit